MSYKERICPASHSPVEHLLVLKTGRFFSFSRTNTLGRSVRIHVWLPVTLHFWGTLCRLGGFGGKESTPVGTCLDVSCCLELERRGRESFMLVPGLCPRVYFYLLALNESAAYKVHQGWTATSALNKHGRHGCCNPPSRARCLKGVVEDRCLPVQ